MFLLLFLIKKSTLYKSPIIGLIALVLEKKGNRRKNLNYQKNLHKNNKQKFVLQFPNFNFLNN